MKINKKYEMFATFVIMVFLMTMIVSFTSVSINNGFTNHFLMSWLKSWTISYVIALPVVIFVMPLSKKIVSKLVEDPKN